MYKRIKIIISFFVMFTLLGCTSDSLKWGQDKWETINGYNESLPANLESNQGMVVFGHQVDKDRCHYSFVITGASDENLSFRKQVINLGISTKEFASFTIATLPVGTYSIKGIECVQSYRIGNRSSNIARFEVKSKLVSNLSVLAITRNQKADAFSTSRGVSKFVRPFTSAEILRIREKYPTVVSAMVDFPMSANF